MEKMIDFISEIYQVMGVIVAIFCFPLVIFFIISVYFKVFRRNRKKSVNFAVAFVVNLALIGGGSFLLKAFSAIAVINEIDEIASGHNFSVKINSVDFSSGEELVEDFVSRNVPPKVSGSHPTKKISVEMKSSLGEIELELFRDSREHNLYWVWYTGYRGTHNGSFLVQTDLFSDY
ncbi:hypothetical protein [Gilvimarinus sp. DA14]|uniref:hypothetical protein n=1 Tax=Gilvimarinus sp. DA14 TaxID=2956798 RepID=UPI0020B775EC|nr:hypothetical protein [Gilvimarinus sp. DA14]UTF59276.1 hypothetical protein NHM04_12410 [Gilvimarinus sp. DA14]